MISFANLDFRRTPATLVLMAVIAAIEIVCTLDDDRRLYFYNGLRLGILPQIWVGELWRPFTTTLLHANFLHALFNLGALAAFGPVIEERLGTARYVALVLLLAFMSMVPEFVITTRNQRPVAIVGFSGVVYGMFGLLWAGRKRFRDYAMLCTKETTQIMVGWFFLCIALTYSKVMMVANIAHGAGLVFGGLVGLSLYDVGRRRYWIPLAIAAILVVLSCLVYCPWHTGYQTIQEIRRLGIPMP